MAPQMSMYVGKIQVIIRGTVAEDEEIGEMCFVERRKEERITKQGMQVVDTDNSKEKDSPYILDLTH